MILEDFVARISNALSAAAASGTTKGGKALASTRGRVRRGSRGRQFHYGELRQALGEFRSAVEAAMGRDHTEFQLLKTALKLTPGATLFGVALEVLQVRFDAAMNRTREAMNRFVAACDAHLGRWEAVPGELEAQGERWDSMAARLSARAVQAETWRTVPGWTGTSADEYAAAAQVQANAISELAGMMSSAASSCRSAAALNMTAFSEVAAITREKTAEVRGQLGFAFGQPYRRTERAAECCEQLTRVLVNVEKMTNSLAGPLQSAVASTMNSGNLLAPGAWPTGTASASVPPAATDSAINEADFYARIRG